MVLRRTKCREIFVNLPISIYSRDFCKVSRDCDCERIKIQIENGRDGERWSADLRVKPPRRVLYFYRAYLPNQKEREREKTTTCFRSLLPAKFRRPRTRIPTPPAVKFFRFLPGNFPCPASSQPRVSRRPCTPKFRFQRAVRFDCHFLLASSQFPLVSRVFVQRPAEPRARFTPEDRQNED